MKKRMHIIAGIAALSLLATTSLSAATSLSTANSLRNGGLVHTEEQKAARVEQMRERLAEKQAAGEITPSEYNDAITNIESGTMSGRMRGMNGDAHMQYTEEQQAARVEQMKERLAEKQAAGEITPSEYNDVITNIESGTMHGGMNGMNGNSGMHGNGEMRGNGNGGMRGTN
ncbi:hypothetical protein AwErysi_05540 [Erysipelotrichaceae bacterium]|nr:hypothetical protein AwErysi_05540 [Erysipelotrichaceae bacterium]